MTASGFYDTTVILAFVGLVAVAGVSLWGRWQQHRARRRFRVSPEYQRLAKAIREQQRIVGTPLVGPLSHMVAALRDAASRSQALPGTVQNPCDPSPEPGPLVRPHLTTDGPRQPRDPSPRRLGDYEARAIAEGEMQT